MRTPPMIPMVETATRPKPGPRDGGAIFDWSVTIDGLRGDILFWAGSYWQDRKDRPVATAPFFRGTPRLMPPPPDELCPDRAAWGRGRVSGSGAELSVAH